MRTSDKVDYDYEQKCFDFYKEENVYELKYDIHDRWNWVLDAKIIMMTSIITVPQSMIGSRAANNILIQ